MIRTTAILATLCAALLAPTAAAQTVDLRPKFQTGRQTRYTMEVTSMHSTAIGEPGEPQETRVRIGLLEKVTEADPEKGAIVDLVFETLKVSIKGPDGNREFDSARTSRKQTDAPEDPLIAALKPAVGSTLTLTIDGDGNITDVRGGQGITAMLEALGKPSDGARELFGPMFSIKKTEPTAEVGESWETADDIDTGAIGDFRMTTRYTLKAADRRQARVEFKGTLEAQTEAAESPLQVKDSTYRGMYLWDLATGQLKSMDSDMNVVIEGDIGGEKVSARSKATTKVTRQD